MIMSEQKSYAGGSPSYARGKPNASRRRRNWENIESACRSLSLVLPGNK